MVFSAFCLIYLTTLSGFQEGKNGKITNKAAKSGYHIPTTSPKSIFFVRSLFLHGIFKRLYDI